MYNIKAEQNFLLNYGNCENFTYTAILWLAEQNYQNIMILVIKLNICDLEKTNLFGIISLYNKSQLQHDHHTNLNYRSSFYLYNLPNNHLNNDHCTPSIFFYTTLEFIEGTAPCPHLHWSCPEAYASCHLPHLFDNSVFTSRKSLGRISRQRERRRWI